MSLCPHRSLIGTRDRLGRGISSLQYTLHRMRGSMWELFLSCDRGRCYRCWSRNLPSRHRSDPHQGPLPLQRSLAKVHRLTQPQITREDHLAWAFFILVRRYWRNRCPVGRGLGAWRAQWIAWPSGTCECWSSLTSPLRHRCITLRDRLMIWLPLLWTRREPWFCSDFCRNTCASSYRSECLPLLEPPLLISL